MKKTKLLLSITAGLICVIIINLCNNLCSAQNFGVGTNTPNSKLHVVQDSAQNAFRVDDEQGDTTAFIIDSAGNVETGGNLKVSGDIEAVNGRIKDKTGFIMPVGTILSYAGATAPEGWLLCNGDTVSRTTYLDLFTAIGTAWGAGDGVTTFHLPDLRGRFARGVDNGAGNDPDAGSRIESNAGGNTGDTVGSLQGCMYENHGHPSIIDYNYTYTTGSTAGTASAKLQIQTTGPDQGAPLNITGSGGNETRPKNVYVNFIIKY